MKKILITATALLIFLTLSVSVSAETSNIKIPSEYESIKDYIPEDVFELLPSDIFVADSEKMIDAVEEMTSFDYLSKIIVSVLNLEIKSSLGLLLTLVAAIILCALDRKSVV